MTTAAPPEIPPTEIEIKIRGKSHLTMSDVQRFIVNKLKTLPSSVYIGEITVCCVDGCGEAIVPDKKFIICPSSQ